MEHSEVLGGDDPRVPRARAILNLSTPGPKAQQEGQTLLADAVTAYRDHPTGDRDRDADWWSLIGRVLRVRSLTFASSEEALALARETLALEPDLALLLPMIPNLEGMAAAADAEYTPAGPVAIGGLKWTLAAEDSAGDGNADNLPDGKELWYASEPSASGSGSSSSLRRRLPAKRSA
jgi:hypothetical protein